MVGQVRRKHQYRDKNLWKSWWNSKKSLSIFLMLPLKLESIINYNPREDKTHLGHTSDKKLYKWQKKTKKIIDDVSINSILVYHSYPVYSRETKVKSLFLSVYVFKGNVRYKSMKQNAQKIKLKTVWYVIEMAKMTLLIKRCAQRDFFNAI